MNFVVVSEQKRTQVKNLSEHVVQPSSSTQTSGRQTLSITSDAYSQNEESLTQVHDVRNTFGLLIRPTYANLILDIVIVGQIR